VAKIVVQCLKIIMGLGLVLLLSLSIFSTSPTVASAGEVKWTRVNIPTEGTGGNWVLADGSDIQHLTEATDGTLYAYGKGLTYTLYKSTNGGYSWSYIGNVQDNIVDCVVTITSSVIGSVPIISTL